MARASLELAPGSRKLALSLAAFAAVSGVAGGAAFLLGWSMPASVLAHTPFTTFLVPGLLLMLVVGGSSALAFALMARRSAFAIDAYLLAGGALAIWIVAEVAMLRAIAWLHVVYGLLGAIMLAHGTREAIRSREPRHRWIAIVTAGETIGYLAPAAMGIVLSSRGVEGAPLVAGLAVAGLAEGFALGYAQAIALPYALARVRYALLTSAAAALVWISIMSIMQLAPALSTGAIIALAIPLASLALVAIGGAQWIELRHHASGARAWIGWTALAWSLALPWSFAAGPFVDASTPLAANLTLWACAGALMAYTMALVTWQGAKRLDARRERATGRQQAPRARPAP